MACGASVLDAGIILVMGRLDRFKSVELQSLRSFCLVATEGSFSGAAKVLDVAPPTVWQHVRGLEEALGAHLVRRRGRVVELTADGQLVFELAQSPLRALESLRPLLEARRAGVPQQLTIASTPYVISCHLLHPVQQFVKEHPSVRFNLRTADLTREVARMVEQGEAQMGVAMYDREEPRSPGLQYEDLHNLPLTLLTAADYPLARQKRITPQDLVKHPFILPPPTTFARRTLQRILQKHGLADQLYVVAEAPTVDVIRKYVAAGLGITLAYVGGEAEEANAGLHQRVFDAAQVRPLALLLRKDTIIPEPAQAFRQLLHLRFGQDRAGQRP